MKRPLVFDGVLMPPLPRLVASRASSAQTIVVTGTSLEPPTGLPSLKSESVPNVAKIDPEELAGHSGREVEKGEDIHCPGSGQPPNDLPSIKSESMTNATTVDSSSDEPTGLSGKEDKDGEYIYCSESEQSCE